MQRETSLPSSADTSLNTRLMHYAAAASAAGVSLLALANQAEAKIIYTPANIPIAVNGGVVQLDLNNDGVADFSFYNASGSPFAARYGKNARPPLGGFFAYMEVIPAQPANSAGAITSFTKVECAAELGKGRQIRANDNWQPGALSMFEAAGDYTSPGTEKCQWHGANNRGGYLALRFTVSGTTYYGWAHIKMGGGNPPTIIGYAYQNNTSETIETGQVKDQTEASSLIPSQEMPEPQPASLGALAKGSLALSIWRRPEEMN